MSAATHNPPQILLTLPPEIHLIILSFLPRPTQYLLSLTCRSLNSLIGPVKLSSRETFDINWSRATDCEKRGRYGVCYECARLLPFYCFSKIQQKKIKNGTRTAWLCLSCLESKNIGLVNWAAPQTFRWAFREWVAPCPVCGRLVRCIPSARWEFKARYYDYRRSVPFGFLYQRGFDVIKIMLAHGTCTFPGRTPKEEAAFMKRSAKKAAGDTMPILRDKIAFLEQQKQQFPVPLLASHADRPLQDLRGLLPPPPHPALGSKFSLYGMIVRRRHAAKPEPKKPAVTKEDAAVPQADT